MWLTYFPNIMIEYYPQMLVVSTLQPESVRRYRNTVEFYYPESIADISEYVEASQAAYLETAREDMEIIARMEQGREGLWRAGRNEVGPYQHPMESGMEHFHHFLRAQLGAAIRG